MNLCRRRRGASQFLPDNFRFLATTYFHHVVKPIKTSPYVAPLRRRVHDRLVPRFRISLIDQGPFASMITRNRSFDDGLAGEKMFCVKSGHGRSEECVVPPRERRGTDDGGGRKEKGARFDPRSKANVSEGRRRRSAMLRGAAVLRCGPPLWPPIVARTALQPEVAATSLPSARNSADSRPLHNATASGTTLNLATLDPGRDVRRRARYLLAIYRRRSSHHRCRRGRDVRTSRRPRDTRVVWATT